MLKRGGLLAGSRHFFIGMRHFFEKNHYLCTLENIIEIFMKEEQAIFIVALFLLLFTIVMSYAMIQDYRILLIQKPKIRKQSQWQSQLQ